MSFFTKAKGLFQLDNTVDKLKKQINECDKQLNNKQKLIDEIKGEAEKECEKTRRDAKNQAEEMVSSAAKKRDEIKNEISILESQRAEKTGQLAELTDTIAAFEKKYDSESKKYLRLRSSYAGVQFAIKNCDTVTQTDYSIEELDDLLSPTIQLHFHSQELKDLRKRAKEVNNQIDNIQKEYESRYTTVAIRAMYQFMTLALRAELQNILYNLKYDKLDKNLHAMHEMIAKCERIAIEGSKLIAPTIKRFLAQMESMFEDLIKIEYEFYIQQERIKEEQRAIREQMRTEAAERRELERQQQQIEKEASKYNSEIESLKLQISLEDEDKNAALLQRIAELEAKVDQLNEKKEEIVNLANGKAGHVYVISNLGSFGENMFKVGMTRRLDPQERIDELSNASVPFGFDVHSMIFSEDAVGLEASLHEELDEKRVNKINLRKEFFRTSLDELEQLVFKYDPTASFDRTMLAEQYRQTLALEQNLIDYDPTAGENDASTNDEDE